MLNVVVLMGRLVADPQLRQTTTGKNVASFRVACDRGRRDANGQNQADFFDVVAWDRSAEFVCRYFQKGSMIAIDGRLQSRNYQDKSGNNRTAIEIVASNINFVTPKSQNPAAGMGAPMASAPIPAAPADYSRPAAPPRWVMAVTPHPWQPPPPVLLCRPILRRAILPAAMMTLH